MNHNSSDDTYIDTHCKQIALDSINILEEKYTPEDLRVIHIDKLRVLIDTVEEFMPKSQIREEKRGLLKYLKHFTRHDIATSSNFI